MAIKTLQTSVLFNSLPMVAAGKIPLANIRQAVRTPSTKAGISRLPSAKPDSGRRASAFAFPRGAENKRIAQEVEQILRNKSTAVTREGTPMSCLMWYDRDALGAYVHGLIHLPRLEALHRLLCGEKGPENSTAFESTQALIPLTSAVLASMGTQVTYANTFRERISKHRRISKRQLPGTWRRLIRYYHSHLRLTDKASYNVAYWADPPYSDIVYQNQLSTMAMGSPVVEGGFLVVQSPESTFVNMPPDLSAWELIFRAWLTPDNDMDGFVMPTLYDTLYSGLAIFRRIK